MNGRRRAVSTVLLLILIAVVLPLGGCWDYRDPDEVSWVMALGLDEGKQNKLTLSAVISVPKVVGAGGASGGGGGGGDSFFVVSMETETILAGLELLNAFADRRADLSHTTWFVFGRSLAEKDLSPYLGPLVRFREFRRNSSILIAQGRAADLLKKGKPILEDNVGKYYQLLHQGWRYTEFIPRNTYHEFYIDAKNAGGAAVAELVAIQDEKEKELFPDSSPKGKGTFYAGRIPREGGGKLEIMGGSVFKGGKMVGILNGDELGAVKMMRGTFHRTILDFFDPLHPDQYVITEIRPRQRPEIKVDVSTPVPHIAADITLEGDVISIQSGEHYERPDRLRILEKAVEDSLMENFEAVIEKSRRWEVDIFRFDTFAKRHFTIWRQWEDYAWPAKYPEAVVDINIDFKIRRVGLLNQMTPLRP